MATINGTSGNDTLNGTFANDTINGFGGNDTINGGAGADVIDGGAGNDTINGGGGNDTITGGTGDDTLTGGTGTDTFIFTAGDGQDVITDLAAGETVQIHGYGAAQSITQVGTSVVVVLSSGDRITFQNTTVSTVQAALQFQGGATSGDDTLNGTSGDDRIDGLAGNDTINGFAGNDTLSGGAGSDVIDGGDGNDTLYSGDVSPEYGFPYHGIPYNPPVLDRGSEVDTLNGGAGDDVIFAGYGDNVDGGGNEYYGDKLFISFQGATSGVTFDGTLTTQVIGGGTITGIENISWVEGSEYDDYINVGDGNGYSDRTVVLGMGGNDTLIAGYYTALLDGGEGNDFIDGRNSQYLQRVDGGAGDDIIYTSANTFVVVNGGDGDDTIYAHGRIDGGSGNDIIYVLDAHFGDPVRGGDGHDTIYGSSGDDVLDGGNGDDVLTGGAGNDTFIVGVGNDVVTDFSAGDSLLIQTGFAGESINQVGSDVVIALSSGDQLTLKNADVATVMAALKSNVNDIAISNDGSKIYVASADGNLYTYSAATGELLYAWDVGIELGGMDLSPDGSFAVITELTPLAVHESPYEYGYPTFTVTAYKVDLTTGEVTSFNYETTDLEYVFHDVAVLANGNVLLSSQFAGSGGVSAKILDLSTGTYTELPWGGEDAVISVSEDGMYVLFAAGNISDAPLVIYQSGVGVVATHDGYADGVAGFNRGLQALNANAKLIAQHLYGDGLHIYDLNLNYIVNLADARPEWMHGRVSGLAFDASGQFLFVLDNQTDTIVQLSTSDWSVVAEYAVGVDITDYSGGFGNRLLVAPDMSYFVVVTDDGWVTVDPNAPTGPTEGDDVLDGTEGDDVIEGLGGNDTLNGLGGNDLLNGGSGNDTLNGGAGNDVLYGGAGDDIMSGGTGDDIYYINVAGDVVIENAGEGYDTVISSISATLSANVEKLQLTGNANLTGTGNALDNALFGNGGANVLFGLGGDDFLNGAGGNDTLYGGAGNDTFNDSSGDDVMYGGTGDDTYYVNSAGDMTIENAGEGIDRVVSTISWTLAAEIENLELVGGNVNGTGNDLANTITGSSGANVLFGLGGDDILNGGAGADTLYGGTGNDTYFVDNAGDVVIENAGEGLDKIFSSVSYTLGANVEDIELIGLGGINATGNALDNNMVGNAKNNVLSGLGGNDFLNGGGGNDTLNGGDGNDILYGGAGDDIMSGGAGDDTYYLSSPGDVVIENAGEGYDTVISPISATLSANVEKLQLTGNANLTGTGNALDNALFGNGGANLLSGLGGNDFLNGAGGNDTLVGGAGADQLVGGTGNDTFLYTSITDSTLAAPDLIRDFASGDRIDLSAIDANSALAGDQAFAFIGSNAFSNSAGELRYETIGGITYVSGDIDGDGIADFMIHLTGSHTLTVGDFVV